MKMANHSLHSQASAWQLKITTDLGRITPREVVPTRSEQLAVVNIYGLLLQWWVGPKSVGDLD